MRSETKERELTLFFNDASQVLMGRAAPDEAWTFTRRNKTVGDPVRVFETHSDEGAVISVLFATIEFPPENGGQPDRTMDGLASRDKAAFFSIEELRREIAADPAAFAPEVRAVIGQIRPHVIRIPYLQKREHDYIYRFRPEKERNRSIYQIDRQSEKLYQSALCRAIKEVKRINERSATSPAVLDFGAVSYLLPSHFGFCLGVQNAIERAYECIAENPGRPVFMLSELIHNPFVNEDLRARGLRYLQSDKGDPLRDEKSGELLWDQLRKDDVVVIPAFGASDEDKARLIEKGIAINRYDATCMLVEKVWKAAQRFGRDGYTVIIHGKAEHEETKATFSNAAKTGPAVIIRNQEEAERLAAVIVEEDPDRKRELFQAFAERQTSGFDPVRDLERLAVVNQTTLLRNETLHIINFLEGVLAKKYGRENLDWRLNSNSKGDTLCYATQVNQDALQRALLTDLDLALVAGGKNSSNTYQLFRLCEERLGERAFYIQSEKNILSAKRLLHYRFTPGASVAEDDAMEERSFLVGTSRPVRILLTGGASCPDGILQQIIFRINSLFPPEHMRDVSDVLEGLSTV